MGEKIISCEDLIKIYHTKDTEVIALQGLDLDVERGELIGIIGSSGSGKSTLLNMIGALDKPDAGCLMVDGKNLLKFGRRETELYRRDTVGFVWQNSARNLIPYLTVQENIKLAMRIRKRTASREENARIDSLLSSVGLSGRSKSKLLELSGGEQQRAAVAVALANAPKILLADEPTGAVDTNTADMVMDIFQSVNGEYGVTVVVVTHDMMLSSKFRRVVSIRDGKTSSEFLRKETFAEEFNTAVSLLSGESHQELTVIDHAGRLQIPGRYLEKLNIRNQGKVRVELEDGKIAIYPQ